MSKSVENDNCKHTEEMEIAVADTRDALNLVTPAIVESSQTSVGQHLTSGNDKNHTHKIQTTSLELLSQSPVLSSTSAATSSFVGLSIRSMNPVVMLTRLESRLTSSGTCDVTKDIKFRKIFSASSIRKTMSKSELKKKTWYDEDESISDISVSDISLSDSEEFLKPEKDKTDKKANEKTKVKHDVKTNISKDKYVKLENEIKQEDYSSGRYNYKRSGEKKDISKEKDSNTKQVKKEHTTDYEDNNSAVVNDESNRVKKVLLTVKENKLSCSDKKDHPKADSSSVSKARHHHNSNGKIETDSANAAHDKADDEKSHKLQDKNKRRHSSDSLRSERGKIKRPKLDRPEQVVQPHQVKDINKKENPRPSKQRYELHLSNINKSDIANEAFRKFINLASDCAVYFTKSGKSPNPLTLIGSVVLYFENASSLQSALQRMSQLPVLSGNQWVEGMIKCFEIRPSTKKGELKDRWRKSLTGKLTFEFSTEKAEKLRQLYAYKDKKREGTKRKSAQIHRIPSTMNHEMLTVLFPFSLNVQISEMATLLKGVEGPVSIEFESQEWMEAVLTCFRQFTYRSSTNDKWPFYLKILNFSPPKPDKFVHQSGIAVPGKSQYPGYNKSQQQNLKGKELSYDPKTQRADMKPRNQGLKRHLMDNPKDIDRKELGQRFDKRSFPEGGKGKSKTHEIIKNTSESRGLQPKNTSWNQRSDKQQSQVLDPQREALRQLAISRGLDPNNQDVIKILEMTTQLEALQALALKQRVEAHSLGIIKINPNPVISAERLQEIPQVRGSEVLKRQHEGRKTAINQAENTSINAWPQKRWEVEKEIRQRQEMERKQQEEYKLHHTEFMLKENIEAKKRQLEELEMRMKHQIDICMSLENSNRNYRQSPTLPPTKSGNVSEEQPFKNAPPTPGLLGPAPREYVNAGQHPALSYTAASGQPALNYPAASAKHEPRENPFPGHHMPLQAEFKHADHNRSRSLRSSRSPDRHSRTSRMSSPGHNKSQSQTDLSNRDRRYVHEGRHESRISNDKRNDKRKLWTKGPPAHSRNDYGRDDKNSVDPNRNDHPLDFNKRPPAISTEQAVKQDQYRTMETLKEIKVSVPPRDGRQQSADEMYLPVQFGKNAVKRTAKEIEEEKRMRFEEKQSEILDREGRDGRRFGLNKEIGISQNVGRAFGGGSNVPGNEKALLRQTKISEHRGEANIYMHNKVGQSNRTSFKNRPGILGNCPMELHDTTKANNDSTRVNMNSPSKSRARLHVQENARPDWNPGGLEGRMQDRTGQNFRGPPHSKEPVQMERIGPDVLGHSRDTMKSQFAGRMNNQSHEREFPQHRHDMSSQQEESGLETEGAPYGHHLNIARENNEELHRGRVFGARGKIKGILKASRGLPDHSGVPDRDAYNSKGRLWSKSNTQDRSLLNETSTEQQWGERDQTDQWGTTKPSDYWQTSTNYVDTFQDNAGQDLYTNESRSNEPPGPNERFVNAEAFGNQNPNQDYNYGEYQNYPQEEGQSWENETFQPFYGESRSAFQGDSRRGDLMQNRTGRPSEDFEADAPTQATSTVPKGSQIATTFSGEDVDEYYGEIERGDFVNPNRPLRGNQRGIFRGLQKGSFRGGLLENVPEQHSAYDARSNSAYKPDQYPHGGIGGSQRGSSMKKALPVRGTQRGRGFSMGRGASFGRGAGLLPCPQSTSQEYTGFQDDSVKQQSGPQGIRGVPDHYPFLLNNPTRGRAGGANFNAFQ
ncbi:unnamed protein product [Lymnaea stagnalis]|uniref:Uncharacterized protein n=1 Tax=Lymnaea stagnalis TaxID=6523 RepID=A0AAV2HGE8_LYMST